MEFGRIFPQNFVMVVYLHSGEQFLDYCGCFLHDHHKKGQKVTKRTRVASCLINANTLGRDEFM
jgi:hypothetical protein